MYEYDPHRKEVNHIVATFMTGKKLLSDIIDDLKPQDKRLSNQSVLIIGQRGIGKSHFLKMLFYTI